MTRTVSMQAISSRTIIIIVNLISMRMINSMRVDQIIGTSRIVLMWKGLQIKLFKVKNN